MDNLYLKFGNLKVFLILLFFLAKLSFLEINKIEKQFAHLIMFLGIVSR